MTLEAVVLTERDGERDIEQDLRRLVIPLSGIRSGWSEIATIKIMEIV